MSSFPARKRNPFPRSRLTRAETTLKDQTFLSAKAEKETRLPHSSPSVQDRLSEEFRKILESRQGDSPGPAMPEPAPNDLQLLPRSQMSVARMREAAQCV